MWADEQRMAVFRCRSRRLVWDLGVFFVVKIERYWCKFQLAGVFVMFFFRDFWQVVFLFKRFFWNAEAFWCLLYLGPYGFQIFSTNSWDSKASCYNESFGGSVFFFPKRLWVTNLWCLAYLQLQHTRRGSFGTIQTPMRLSSWSSPTRPNKRMVWVNGLLQSPI